MQINLRAYIYFSTQTKDKSQAYFSIGSGRRYYEPDFSKKLHSATQKKIKQ